MTPLDFAQRLADSGDPDATAMGVAIVARGLSDPDPHDPYRAGWPLSVALTAAAKYLGVIPSAELLALALRYAPDVSDAELNRSAE